MSRRWFQVAFRWAEQLSAAHERLAARPPAPADVLVLTAYTADVAAYGDFTAANKQAYARRHGYAFAAITTGFDPTRPPAWSKIVFLRRALRRHRWVFWTDADALVMNPAVRLEQFMTPGSDVHLTRALAPFPHLNTGHMLFRSSPFTRLFLAATWRLTAFIHDSTWEQRAINHLVDHYRFARVRVWPNRAFNSYGRVPNDPDPYQPGDFVVHVPGLPNKLPVLREFLAAAPGAAEAARTGFR